MKIAEALTEFAQYTNYPNVSYINELFAPQTNKFSTIKGKSKHDNSIFFESLPWRENKHK